MRTRIPRSIALAAAACALGHAAGIPLLLGTALVLGSAWALVPALLGVVDLLVRTALEDDFFMKHLDGYQAYARRTPSRADPRRVVRSK